MGSVSSVATGCSCGYCHMRPPKRRARGDDIVRRELIADGHWCLRADDRSRAWCQRDVCTGTASYVANEAVMLNEDPGGEVLERLLRDAGYPCAMYRHGGPWGIRFCGKKVCKCARP